MGAVIVGLTSTLAMSAGAIDLLQRYPTALTEGALDAAAARPWQFTGADLFEVSSFHFELGALTVDTGPAALGVGHCEDGAVWAIVIPNQTGELKHENRPAEKIANVWLRFHPSIINRLFPPGTVKEASSGAP